MGLSAGQEKYPSGTGAMGAGFDNQSGVVYDSATWFLFDNIFFVCIA